MLNHSIPTMVEVAYGKSVEIKNIATISVGFDTEGEEEGSVITLHKGEDILSSFSYKAVVCRYEAARTSSILL